MTALEAAALLPMLLPSWMDPDQLIKSFGAYALWGVAFIVFAECGLFAILPGDSLLFTVGLLTATGVIPHNLAFVCIVLTIAAVLGNVSGYAIGRKIGPPLFRPRSGLAGKIFKQSHVDKTHVFLERYGNRALDLGALRADRPHIRHLVAGVGKMNFRHFITYTAIGGVLWACGVTIAGYFLGNIPVHQEQHRLGADLDRGRLVDPDGCGVLAASAAPEAGNGNGLKPTVCALSPSTSSGHMFDKPGHMFDEHRALSGNVTSAGTP